MASSSRSAHTNTRARRWREFAVVVVAACSTLLVGTVTAGASSIDHRNSQFPASSFTSPTLAVGATADTIATSAQTTQLAAVAAQKLPKIDFTTRVPWPAGKGGVEIHVVKGLFTPWIDIDLRMSTKARHFALQQGVPFVASLVCEAVKWQPVLAALCGKIVDKLVKKLMTWLSSKDRNHCWVEFRFRVVGTVVMPRGLPNLGWRC
jgi:hypothetical protein